MRGRSKTICNWQHSALRGASNLWPWCPNKARAVIYPIAGQIFRGGLQTPGQTGTPTYPTAGESFDTSTSSITSVTSGIEHLNATAITSRASGTDHAVTPTRRGGHNGSEVAGANSNQKRLTATACHSAVAAGDWLYRVHTTRSGRSVPVHEPAVSPALTQFRIRPKRVRAIGVSGCGVAWVELSGAVGSLP